MNSGLWLVTELVGIYGVSRAVTVLYQREGRFGLAQIEWVVILYCVLGMNHRISLGR